MPSVIVHIRFWKYALQQVYQSASYEKVSCFREKKDRYIWCILLNPLLLHPLSRMKAAIDWHSETKAYGRCKREKKKWKIIFRKCLEDIEISPYLCSPTRKEKELLFLRSFKRALKEKEKNFRKYLEDILKSFYLCIRFWKRRATEKEAIFEEIYINNTSSTRASLLGNKKDLGKIKRTVNTCL